MGIGEINGPVGIVDEAAVRSKYAAITRALIASHTTITTMESCTSGQVASLITDTEGASAILKGAFVTYSNEAKVLQGVSAATIERFGVYSSQTAVAMAEACRATYGACIGVGITGSFGNVDPNNADSVPGEVFFALAVEGKTKAYHCTIPAQPSRLAYKLYIADVLAGVLMSQKG
ncbi:MAG: CinA family protein [Coriobacteriales bacterium]|nr:CinA family protein [Coriobacteriales bacterium]